MCFQSIAVNYMKQGKIGFYTEENRFRVRKI